MKKLALLSVFAFFASTSAYAGVYIEPYVGYGMGSSKGDFNIVGVGTATVDQTNKGLVFGGKLGMSSLGLAGGLDYSQFKSKDHDKTGSNPDSDSTVTNIGVFVQYKFPILFKVSASYLFSAESKTDDTTSTGSGFKIGAGYTGLPFVAINVDYISTKSTKIKSDLYTIDNVDVKSDLTMLSVSLPFDF